MQFEKMLISDVSLIGGTSSVFSAIGNWVPDGGVTPPPPQPNGTAADDTLTGTAAADPMNGFGGNETIRSPGGNDTVNGGQGGDSLVFGNLDRVTDFSDGRDDEIVFAASLGLDLADIAVAYDATGATIALGTRTMRLHGVTEAFDLGSHIKFDHTPSFEFL